MSNQEIINKFNKILKELKIELPRPPRMRYWKNGRYAYGWTTEPTIIKNKKKFYTFKYRILKNKTWKLSKKIAFSKRKTAKARAHKWYTQSKTILEE